MKLYKFSLIFNKLLQKPLYEITKEIIHEYE